jgi:hypothetical protein
MTIKSGQAITVKPGCHIPTMDHIITANESEEMEIVNSWLDWTMSLSQLFNHDDYDQLTAMITDLRKHINGDYASQLLQRLDMVQKPFSADHWRFSSPAVMFRSGYSHSCSDICHLEEMLCSGTSHSSNYRQCSSVTSNLRSNSSHLFNHRCLSNNRRRRRILSKIQLSVFQSQRPLSSFTPNQREGIMSFFTVLFRTLDFTCTFIFHFILHFFISCLISL